MSCDGDGDELAQLDAQTLRMSRRGEDDSTRTRRTTERRAARSGGRDLPKSRRELVEAGLCG